MNKKRFLCIKTNSYYEFWSEDNTDPDYCVYHFWLKHKDPDLSKPNISLLQQILDENEVCEYSINHVKKLIELKK